MAETDAPLTTRPPQEPADSVVDQAVGVARGAADSRAMDWAARAGLAARGTVYVLMGLLTLAVAQGAYAEVDQKGALREVISRPYGGALVLLIGIGLACYALWRLSEAAFGAVGHRRDEVVPRLQSLFRGLLYGGLSVTAFTVLAGSGSSQSRQQSGLTAQVMGMPGGRLLVAAVGAAVVVVAVVLLVEGVQQRFLRYFDHAGLTGRTRTAVRVTGTVGTVARAVVFALAGGLVVAAAWTQDPDKAGGIDAAVDELRGQAWGGAALLVLAVGLLLFGVYGLAEARYRRV
jgi:Domain of Unknown Function (DUF1206)